MFLLPRTQDRPSRIAPALRDAGAEVVEAPDSASAAAALGGRVPSVILFPSSGSVGAITEYLRDAARRRRTGRWSPRWARPRRRRPARTAGRPDVVAPSPEVGAFVQSVTRFVLENGA